MAATTTYSFLGYATNPIGDGKGDVDIVSTGTGFAITTTRGPLQSALDIYDGNADPIGNTAAVTTGTNAGIARFSNGNLVTVGEGNGNLFYDIESATGSAILGGNFGVSDASQADVAVLRPPIVFNSSTFVTAYTKEFNGESDVLVDIRDANGNAIRGFDIDDNSAYSDSNAHVVSLAPRASGTMFQTGGFAVLFDRFEPNGAIGGKFSLMYAVYNADGSVRQGPTEIASNSSRPMDGDIVAYGDGFATTWIDRATGNLELRVLDSNGVTTSNGGTTTIYDPQQVNLGHPTLTTLSNGYFGIAVETYPTGSGPNIAPSENTSIHSKMLIMADVGFGGIRTLYAGQDTFASGNLYNMDSAGFGTGQMVIGGDTAAENSTQARHYVEEGHRSSISDDASDTIVGDDLFDTMSGNGGDDTLSGLGSDDDLYGGAGKDVLDGGTGNDVMIGGTQDDRYVVDSATDKVIEAKNAGYDTVDTTLTSYTLGANLERVNHTSTGSFVGVGNALDNRFAGNVGDDRFIDVAGGSDLFSGGSGNDVVDFRTSATAVSINLGTGVHGGAATGDTYASIETFFGSDVGADTMKAGAGKINFSGFGGNDILSGGNYVDRLQGGAGDDKPAGGNAADSLQGGEGNDTLIGGKDTDAFLFVEPKFGADAITDFEDGSDLLKIFHTVADDVSDFTITGNGSSHVVVTLKAGTANKIAIDGINGAHITIDAHDFMFY